MSVTQGLCALGSNNLYAAWKGEVGDDRLFYARYDGTNFVTASLHIPGNSSVGPSLASPNPSTLYAAWKGEHGYSDQRLFYAMFDGSAWLPQVQIANMFSSVGPALGTLKGVLYAAWKGQEGDNQIYWSLLNGSKWETQQPIPGATSLVGPSLAEYGGVLYAGWRGAVNDPSLHFAQFDGSTWTAAPSIPDNPSSFVGPSLAQHGDSLYAAWTGKDPDQAIYYAVFSKGGWSGWNPIASVASSVGPALAGFGPKLYAMWKGKDSDQSLYYASFDGSWSTQKSLPGNTGQDVAPTPESGLGDNSNYWLYSDCNPITDLKVTIEVTQDMIYESTTKGTGKGFSFQLNAFSKIGPDIIPGWQQFIYNINTADSGATVFHGQFENWVGTHTIINGVSTATINGTPVGKSDLINLGADVITLPTNGVPVNYRLTISLGTDGSSSVVNSATFSVYDPTNGQTYSKTISPLNQQLDSSLPAVLRLRPIQETDFAPILAFQLVLVGPDETQVKLSSGAGNITYTASSPLTALSAPPSCVKNVVTGENSNSVYSTISAGTGATLTQTFWVAN
jgi:hypothetical protein